MNDKIKNAEILSYDWKEAVNGLIDDLEERTKDRPVFVYNIGEDSGDDAFYVIVSYERLESEEVAQVWAEARAENEEEA